MRVKLESLASLFRSECKHTISGRMESKPCTSPPNHTLHFNPSLTSSSIILVFMFRRGLYAGDHTFEMSSVFYETQRYTDVIFRQRADHLSPIARSIQYDALRKGILVVIQYEYHRLVKVLLTQTEAEILLDATEYHRPPLDDLARIVRPLRWT